MAIRARFRALSLPTAVLMLGMLLPVTLLLASGPDNDIRSLTLPTLEGDGELSLADYRDQVVYLDFWASWCAPCRQSLPLYAELQQRHGADGLQVLAVSLDEDPDAARRFLERHPVNYPVMIDVEAASPVAWGVRGMPTAFLLDRSGRLVGEFVGFEPEHIDEVEQAIVEQLRYQDD